LEGIAEQRVILNPTDYKEAIRNGEDFYIQFSLFTPDVEEVVHKTLHRYLENYDLLYMKDMLLTTVKEFINNAVKANAKRLFFIQNQLDIKSKEEYIKGMETFKEEVFVQDSPILQALPQANYIVRVFFKVLPERLRVSVINNTPILEEELKKVESRIKKAYQYSDITEAFEDVLDDSEGAGLGLIMALMLFKNVGFPRESFSITTDGKITMVKLVVPKYTDSTELQLKVAEEILDEIQNIPSFPENIIEIQRLCANPDSTIREIAESIKRDPGLTTALLKLANSAGYITIKRVETIEEAVKIIGTKGVNTLLVASGVQRIMESRYKKFEAIWKTSYQTAFYAQRIAMQLKRTKLSEFAYLSALLSDLGRIVLLSIKPEDTAKIIEITGNKHIADTNILEEITLGISHSTLASLICRKWKFNEALVKTIEYHHRPHMAPEKYRDLVFTVYLAYMFSEIENRNSRFEMVDEDVLEYFNLTNKKNFEMLHNILKDAYQSYINPKI
jgi:HD-like signal output (HDOD) protein